MEKYEKDLKRVFTRWNDFRGRSDRRTFLVFFGFILIVTFLISISPILVNIFTLIIFVPGLSLTIRRLHDTNHSAWYIVIDYILRIPLFAEYLISDSFNGHIEGLLGVFKVLQFTYFIFLFYLLAVVKGDEGTNNYGKPFDREIYDNEELNKEPDLIDIND